MIRQLLVGFASVSVLLIGQESLDACQCKVPSLTQATEEATEIFRAEVVGIELISTGEGDPAAIVRLRVGKVFKGTPVRGDVTLHSWMSFVDCRGTAWIEKKVYLVYAKIRPDSQLEDSNSCSRTLLLEYAGEDLKVLGPGRKP